MHELHSIFYLYLAKTIKEARRLQWNGVQEVFQDIVYCRCGNKSIMISKNIGVAIAPLAPLLRGPWLKRTNCCAEADLTGSKSTTDLNLLFLFLPEMWYLKPKIKLIKCVFSFKKYWIFHFVPSERTDFRKYPFL